MEKNENLPFDAESVGYGVERPRPIKTVRKTEVALDKPFVWMDKPQMVGQYLDATACRLARCEVRIFDFSIPKELSAYNDLLTRTSDPDHSNEFVGSPEMKYSEITDNWKAMVLVRTMQFKKLFDTAHEATRFKEHNV